ncbi:hypothetical protein [Anthocerotibacter panamensis]|uniref:hypothetical protein n=1 Tax=Anthocerotibacter panamensis TaxID=2857077 RepID=UPI001C402BE8|nr:hypothetical protein [Anthocerotibacter panamensis]
MPIIRPLSFDGSFELEESAKQSLFQLLHAESFRQQVSQNLDCAEVVFLELLFQPVPYSPTTPHGMAPEFEPYHRSSDHAIINVPANFLFKAKISKPNRLCAIYRKRPATD